MITLFQLFKMIFGIIVAAFILYALLNYSGSYSVFQESGIKAKILNNFRETAQDVYYSGNAITYTDFSAYDFSGTRYEPLRNPPLIVSEAGEMDIWFPLFFVMGENVYIHRGSLDYKFWKFYFVEALPDMNIIFNPVDNTPDAWEIMQGIVELMPDTAGTERKIYFGLCDGDFYETNACGGKPCSRNDFLNAQSTFSATRFDKCTASLPQNSRLVVISSGCTQGYANSSICIIPSGSGVGNFYISGSPEKFIYRDSLDLLSAVLGGTEQDAFGKTQGEKFYEYKNRIFGERLKIASDITAKRSLLVTGRLNPDTESTDYYCRSVYISLEGITNQIKSLVSNRNYYTNTADQTNLKNLLEQAKLNYQELVNRGCEYQ